MAVLVPDDFRLIDEREALANPRLRRGYLNLLAIAMEEPDVAAAVAGMDRDPLYDAATLHPMLDMREAILVDALDQPVGKATFELNYRQNGFDLNSYIHPAYRGRGYGSVLLAKTLELAGTFTGRTVRGVIADSNRPSWQMAERLEVAGLARRDPDRWYLGKLDRVYHLQAGHPAAVYHRALLVPARPAPRSWLGALGGRLRRTLANL